MYTALRWVFQGFMAVHWVLISGGKQIVNLTPERPPILTFFSDRCRGCYLLHGPDPSLFFALPEERNVG